jgi:hypothetical protein
MLPRFAWLSLLLGGCAPAALHPAQAPLGAPPAPSAVTDASPRSARVRRVARLAPPFVAQATARRVSATERDSTTALAITR